LGVPLGAEGVVGAAEADADEVEDPPRGCEEHQLHDRQVGGVARGPVEGVGWAGATGRPNAPLQQGTREEGSMPLCLRKINTIGCNAPTPPITFDSFEFGGHFDHFTYVPPSLHFLRFGPFSFPLGPRPLGVSSLSVSLYGLPNVENYEYRAQKSLSIIYPVEQTPGGGEMHSDRLEA